jgi:hypothetical protein
MKTSTDCDTRVRVEVPIWANFGDIWMEVLKGACSYTCITISDMEQYENLRDHLAVAGVINAEIDIPSANESAIFASYLYCLGLTNRIPETPDDNP